MLLHRIFSRTINRSYNSSTGKIMALSVGPQCHPGYETCVDVLNSLQSNAKYIKATSSMTPTAGSNHNATQLVQVQKYLLRSGISLEKLDGLSVIHVAGTKGKGTTCALSESILRHHGYKTGFFSSPHLLEVRERIRINGKPIGKDEFAKSFWEIYTALDKQKDDELQLPFYFCFLTLMAFRVFLEQKVDVAIMEVGIGGEYDCTNILRKVPVVGITSLGIDHTALLGNTLKTIAWNKAGIMKEGCRAFTVPQPEEAMEVLKERSVQKKCQLEIVETLNFKFPQVESFPANILNLNSSLAVALCDAWLSIKHNNNLTKHLSKEVTEKALASCQWPGRFQIKKLNNVTYYIDGAHTKESIEICSRWFEKATIKSKKKKVLMFNLTGDRDSETLLKLIRGPNRFDGVLFVTNNATNGPNPTDEQLHKCGKYRDLWFKLDQDENIKSDFVRTFSSVTEGITFLNQSCDHVELLVTGSLHLIGATLSILEPNLNDNYK